MRKISPQQQTIIQEDVEKSSHYITENLEKIASDQWTDLSTTSDTVKRLKRKGYRDTASQYMRFKEMSTSEPSSEKKIDFEELIKSMPGKKEMNDIVKEGIVGSNDMMSSNFLHKGSRVARSVGRISNRNTREALGTGFLVSPNLIITNNHVIPNEQSAATCIIEFDFFSDNSGNPIEANEFNLEPQRLFLTSDEDEFDFTLIAIQTRNRAGIETKQFGWIRLIEETGKAHIGERLNIIHHPLGQPQHISIRKNLLVTHEESAIYLKYMTDTEPGSSGSPVLNDEWELVALHRASEEIDDENQKQLYFQAMRDVDKNLALELKGKEVTINFGVRISTIANHIKTRLGNFNAQQQELLKEIFRRGPANVQSLSFTDSLGESMQFSGSGGIDRSDEIPPITINFNFGDGRRSFSMPSEVKLPIGDKSGHGLTGVNRNAQLEIFNNKINSQKSVFKALSFLEEARAKTYLPRTQDINANKNAYYEDYLAELNNGGLTAKDKYDKLNKLLFDTLELVDQWPDVTTHLESMIPSHRLESIQLESGGVTYAKARAHLYTWVDLQEDRMLKGVYTLAPIPPEQLLLKDLIQSLDIDGVELPPRFRSNQFLNCEHIVPKSLFDNDRMGWNDLHHLITAEGATNTFRNNRPYRDLADNVGRSGPANLVEYIKPGGKITTEFFEPKNNKALVARATLYFIVCHKQKLPDTVYDQAAINTLINWSKSKKPSRYELHRNESIFELQGNRNPFIDFPDWVDEIDFMEGLRN